MTEEICEPKAADTITVLEGFDARLTAKAPAVDVGAANDDTMKAAEL